MNKWHSILIALIILITSCNPFVNKELRKTKRCNRKLERITQKCPGLLKPDTIIKTITIEIPPIYIDTSLSVNDNVAGIDSIIAKYQMQIDSILARKLGTEIKWYVRERPCVIDTLKFEQDGIKVKVFQQGDRIRISIKRPKEIIKEKVKIETPKVVKIKLTWWQKFMDFLGRFWWWIVGIAVILGIGGLVKKYGKRIFRLYSP